MWANKFKREDLKRLVKVFMIVMAVFGLAKPFNKAEVIKEATSKAVGINALSAVQTYLKCKEDGLFNTREDCSYLIQLLQEGNRVISNEDKDTFIQLVDHIQVNNEKEVGRLFHELLPKYVDKKHRTEFNELCQADIDGKLSEEEYANKLNALVKKQIRG